MTAGNPLPGHASHTPDVDAVVVGAGPNGLAAAIILARAGCSVVVFEAAEAVGGGTRSAELTLPGYLHDECSAIHPLGVASPFFRSLPMGDLGVTWVHPEAPLVHPLDGEAWVTLERSLAATAAGLEADGDAYGRLFAPLVEAWEAIAPDLLAPLGVPRHPLAMARFGWHALQSAAGLARRTFSERRARALFAGMAAHAMLPLERPVSAAFGLVLGTLGHAAGWPVARGGSQRIADALVAHLEALGGEIHTGHRVESLDELPAARTVLLDVTPQQVLSLAEEHLPRGYARALARFRYGPGVFKIDYALDGPVPWAGAAGRRAATLHLGGTLEEIARAERAVWAGKHPERPFVLVAQQSAFDPTRAPEGRHTLWAYCHVPHGSTVDMTGAIDAQIERFAPGFGEQVLARHTRTAREMETYNPNYIGGDINGGVQDLGQLFTRPAARLVPYSTPVRGLYLCSSSTPPGGGVHGMCGYHAARAALKAVF